MLIKIRNRASSINYSFSLSGIPSDMHYRVPDSLTIKAFCPSVITQNVTLYSQYWDVNICGRFVSGDPQIIQVQQALTQTWIQKNTDIDSSCHCLYVDIFEGLIQNYANQLG